MYRQKKFEATYAGGEANVAVSLANYGMDAAFVSKVPAHEIGQCAVNELRRYGVDTSLLLRGGTRLGVYYCEKGASQRASKVIYDRAGSAIAAASAKEFDWDKIFSGADWFHWTGITPALGGEMPQACMDACKAAREKGLTISCDLNYRKKLWTREQALVSAWRSFCPMWMFASLTKKGCEGCVRDRSREHGHQLRGSSTARGGYISVARQIAKPLWL